MNEVNCMSKNTEELSRTFVSLNVALLAGRNLRPLGVAVNYPSPLDVSGKRMCLGISLGKESVSWISLEKNVSSAYFREKSVAS